MNWILLVVAAVLVIGAYVGYKKGIIRIAVSLVSMVVSLIACMFVTPALCTAIKSNTEIHGKMTESVYNMIINSDSYNSAFEETLGQVSSTGGSSAGQTAGTTLTDSAAHSVAVNLTELGLGDYEEQISAYVEAIANAMKLPASVMQEYTTSLVSENVSGVIADKAVSVKSLMAAIFAARLADMAINSIVYVAVFAVIFVVLKIVLVASGIIASLPLIRQANRIVGLAFGFIEALVIVWLIFAVITACSNFEWAQSALAMIGDNAFLTFIYEQNLITKTILG